MKFSIVTPSYNGFRYLERTARSVLSQRGDFDLQWIVVDGGSADGTHDFLRSLAGDPRVTWTSEPDRGQSHAINKGLSVAEGEVVAWLNSDDLYAPGALQGVADAFRRDDARAQWVVGRCDVVDFAEREIRPNVTRYKDHLLRRYSFRRLLRENFISQPAVFWRRDFGRQVGPLDESLHYTMDYDLWLRMAKLCDPLVLGTLLAHFRLHGQSKSGRVQREQFDEQYRVASNHFGDDWQSRVIHKLNVEKIVGAYRVMRALGW